MEGYTTCQITVATFHDHLSSLNLSYMIIWQLIKRWAVFGMENKNVIHRLDYIMVLYCCICYDYEL